MRIQRKQLLFESFIYIIYILQLQQPFNRLKMEILMPQCKTETTQTTIDKTLTTTFSCLRSVDYNVNKTVYRYKAKTLISLRRN